jgi:glycosyltransferase involved in cell wall biosynthesis
MSDHENRPRILLIKPVLPYPPDQGTKVVSFGLIQALKRDFEVTVLARLLAAKEGVFAGELERHCSRVITILAPNMKSIFHRLFFSMYYKLKSVLLKQSLKSLYDCPGIFLKAALKLSKEPFDLIIIEYWQLFQLARFFPSDKVVLLTHDIDLLINKEITLLERQLFRKIAAVRRWLLERDEELRAYRSSKNTLTLTERDKEAVSRVSSKSCIVKVLPYGVDIEYFSPPGIERNPREILFLGAMSAVFNQDALAFFITKIYPLLDNLGEFSITVVGGVLPKELAYFSLNREVEVIGKVRDIRPYLHRAACMIVPLRFGGGLRIRILEAMAAGLPVVCTDVAMAGLPFEAPRDYLAANTPEEFSLQLEKLLNQPELGRSMAENAMNVMMEKFSKNKQEERARALFHSLIDN